MESKRTESYDIWKFLSVAFASFKMKYLLSYFFFSICFFASVFAADMGTISSKIDWENSQLVVTEFVPLHKDGADMDCFGEIYAYSDLTPWSGTASKSLADLGFASDLPNDDLTLNEAISSSKACFQQAGSYTYHLKLVDKAGNETLGSDQFLVIKPGNIDQSASAFTVEGYQKDGESFTSSATCSGVDLVANKTDKCTLLTVLKDEFGNILSDRGFSGKVTSQNINGSYNTILNGVDSSDAAFTNGLRLDTTGLGLVGGQQIFSSDTDIDGQKQFSFQAYVPSLEIVTGSIFDFVIAKMENESVKLDLTVQNVDNEGDEILSETTLTSVPLGVVSFLPQAIAQISDQPPVGSPPVYTLPSDPLQFLFEEWKDFYITAKGATAATDLPLNLDVFLQGFTPEPSIFANEDISYGDTDINVVSETDGYEFNLTGGVTSESNSVETKLFSKGGHYDDLNIALGSKIKYSVDGHDIVFPSGILGNTVGGTVIFPNCSEAIPPCAGGGVSSAIVGADIEGVSLINNDNYTFATDSKTIKVGNLAFKDIRKVMREGAYEILRGTDFVDASSGVDFDINSDFGSDKVKYFKNGLVRLTGGVFQGGKRTIIVEDGNLFITGDLSYANVDDSLGIILINSVTNDYAKGNIFIHKDVQRIIGTYFADGGFVSSNVLVDATPSLLDDGVDIDDRENLAGSFDKQLLLNGIFLTQNTLGGYLLENLLTPYGQAADVSIGTYSDEQESILYDLHFMRRYVPVNLGSSLVIDNPNCASVDGVNCDKNIHSFVVRPDGKVNSQSPPGFDGFSEVVR